MAVFLSIYLFFIPFFIGRYPGFVLNYDKYILGQANITQVFNNHLLAETEYHTNELTAIENANGKLQMIAIFVVGFIIFELIAISSVLFLFQCPRMIDNVKGEEMSISYYMFQKKFNDECDSDNSKSLQLSKVLKFIVILQFLILSCIFWWLCINGFLYLKYIASMNIGSTGFFIGRKFIEATILLGLSLFGNISKTLFYVFVFSFLVLPILPIIIFLYLHIRSFIVSLNKLKDYIPIDKNNDVCKKIYRIADEIGIKGINCIKNPNSNDVTPLAKIHGIIPKKYIILTDNGIKFLLEHPDYFEAIIAHEIYHFIDGSKQLWWYALLSRLSLTGAGFLSVLHDMVDMEDRADKFARKYLKEHKMDETLLKNAIIEILEVERKEMSSFRSDVIIKRSIKDDVKSFFLTFYELYFDTEWYAYLHRSWFHRCNR